jgi:hypothetical protein
MFCSVSKEDDELLDDFQDESEVSEPESSSAVLFPLRALRAGELVCKRPKPSNSLFDSESSMSFTPNVLKNDTCSFDLLGKKQTSFPVSDHRAPQPFASGTKMFAEASSLSRAPSTNGSSSSLLDSSAAMAFGSKSFESLSDSPRTHATICSKFCSCSK